MKSSIRYLFTVAGLPALCAACGASAPSQELRTARDAYAATSRSDAAQLNPEGTREAQKALQAAERAYDESAGSEKERTYAYVATRKSELAIAQAEEERARQARDQAEQAYQARLEQQLRSAQQEIASLRAASQNAENAESARQQAEIGWQREGDNLVISLTGVSFETGGAKLSDEAMQRLDVIAQALQARPGRPITIVGYTDNKGSAQANRALSQKRADAVKDYLESRGVDSSRLSSVGRGASHPVASNASESGRAENRRVEIVLQRPGAAGEREPVRGTEPARQHRQQGAPPREPERAPMQPDQGPMQQPEPIDGQ